MFDWTLNTPLWSKKEIRPVFILQSITAKTSDINKTHDVLSESKHISITISVECNRLINPSFTEPVWPKSSDWKIRSRSTGNTWEIANTVSREYQIPIASNMLPRKTRWLEILDNSGAFWIQFRKLWSEYW